MTNLYQIRLCDISSTRWRSSDKTVAERHFDLTEHFKNFYQSFDELPTLLAQKIYPGDSVTAAPHPTGRELESFGDFQRVEVVLFALPFPANQIVSAVVLDFAGEISDEDGENPDEPSSTLRQLLTVCAESRLLVGKQSITEIVAELADKVKADKEVAADTAENDREGFRERHALVLVDGDRESAPDKETIAGILYGIRRPYQREFITLEEPKALNREAGHSAAVTQYSSFLYGQQPEVQNSVLLTTVQAVGTAARFQRIWHDAYFHVQQFQNGRLIRKAGLQTRKSLETLADELGNLELDLAFSVETAADLGLGSATARIDDFHHHLYQVMQIRTRAHTVGQMFVRLSGSLGSELTAIESREKEIDESYRLRAAIILGVLSFLVAPVGLLFAFFGINASQINAQDSVFDWHQYYPAYVFVAFILVVAFVLAWIGPSMQRRARRRRQERMDKPEV